MTTPGKDVISVEGPAGPLGVLSSGSANEAHGRPSLLLLHGIQGTALAWRAVTEALPPGGPVLAPDLRGRRASARPGELQAYALERFAEDLAAIIRWHARPVVIAGWSMGVLVTLTYLRDYGLDGVSGLALIGGTAFPGGQCPWFRGTEADEIGREAEARARSMGLSEYADAVAVAGSWLSARQADLRPVLSRITVPTRVIHGDGDAQCPVSHGRAMAEAIPGAELSVLPGRGHGLPAEVPGQLAECLDGLRARCAWG